MTIHINEQVAATEHEGVVQVGDGRGFVIKQVVADGSSPPPPACRTFRRPRRLRSRRNEHIRICSVSLANPAT